MERWAMKRRIVGDLIYSSVDPQERSYRAKKIVREMSASMLDGM